MSRKNALLGAIIVLLSAALSAVADEKPKFVVVTKDKLGMKDGDDFYQFGMAIRAVPHCL